MPPVYKQSKTIQTFLGKGINLGAFNNKKARAKSHLLTSHLE
jgi:hypothetical protein